MKEPSWLRLDVVLSVHERLLAEHGGRPGLRDAALLESALGRPANLVNYGKLSMYELAAAYACGIIQSHPFIDGKRTGFMAAYLFLGINRIEVVADESDVALETLAVAAGEMSESEYARWLQQVSVKRSKRR